MPKAGEPVKSTTIALAILAEPALLRLRPRLLARDAMERFGVSYRTARVAITLARENYRRAG